MEADKKTAAPGGARLAEIAYQKRQNRAVIIFTAPGMLLFCGLHFYLSNYFQSSIFGVMFVNAIAGLIIINYLKDLQSLTIYKRISAGIAFGLLATSLLTGLLGNNIYLFLPWMFIYPLAAVIFFSRGIGFFTAGAFSIAALIVLLTVDLPPWTVWHVKMFKFNALIVMLYILLITIIYEKIRMKVQDDLALSQNKYRLAELSQRETNMDLQQEIERREQSEKALAKSELHYRALFEESVVPLWEEDWSQVKIYLDGLPQEIRNNLSVYLRENTQALEKCISLMQVKAVNRATLKLYNTDSPSTLLGNLSHIMSPDTSGFVVNRMLSLYLTGRYNAELIGTSLNGNKLHLLVSSTLPAGYENSWEKVFSSVYDVTERVAMEEAKKRVDQQMQNARQLQAVATLAGGIAHQFNNSLAVIYGSLDLLEMNAQGNMGNRRFLTSLKTSARRMSRLTDQLLAYAEGGKYQPQLFSVNDLINDIISSKTMLRDSSIQVISELGSDIHMTTGDITQIKMVVEVVLSNAFEALHQGGVVKITTGYKLIGEPVTINDQLTKPGVYTFICVEDSGAGMKEETLQHIFEPFFTTKIYGRGLGMAAAFGIVRNHDGMITVDSELGKGTKVVIYLPGAGSQENRLSSLQ